MLTLIKTIDAATLRKLICTNDTSEDGKKTASYPPADRVSKEIDLLSSIILRPETDTPKEERPLDWLAGVRMAAGEGIVVEEDGALQLKVLDKEWQTLDFPFFFDEARAILRNRWYLINVPNVAGLLKVLIAVDFGLLVSPIRKRSRVCPHCDSRWGMDQLEVAGHALQLLARFCTFDFDFKKSVVVTRSVSVL